MVSTPIKVFLLDDHEIVRRGLRDRLESEGDIRVVGEASTADQAVRRVQALDPDVAVLDLRLAEGNYVTSVLSNMGMARSTEAAVYAARHLHDR